jgi:alpha/beta superfamily hydrolase
LDGSPPGRYSHARMISEQPATIDVGAGVALDIRVAVPPGARAGVVLCHPHPLYGGDMDSGVVTRAAEACADRDLATLRFNFRGVGASTGTHDDGRGEQDDTRAALANLRRRLPAGAAVALAGYSFGAAVAAAVAQRTPVAGLALIAPPLRLAALQPPAAVAGPILVVVGAEDQYCPEEALQTIRDAMPQATITVIDGADHFFFGSLEALTHAVGGWAAAVAT